MEFILDTNYYVGLLLLGLTLAVLLGLLAVAVLALGSLVSFGWCYLVNRQRWYRPSRRASRQLNIARRKHAQLLAAYRELRGHTVHVEELKANAMIMPGDSLAYDPVERTVRARQNP